MIPKGEHLQLFSLPFAQPMAELGTELQLCAALLFMLSSVSNSVVHPGLCNGLVVYCNECESWMPVPPSLTWFNTIVLQ